jgi:outer membrane receptor protein involved in Fe transport
MKGFAGKPGRSAASALVVALLSSSAYAQVAAAQDAAAPAATSVTEVVVTGTRIKRREDVSNSPLTTVSAQEIKYEGATEADEVLSRLPQFTADENEYVSNGASGTSNVNLRNLGSNRVLVLINGQRMMPTQAVDLNFVPSSLIDRVDVVTGGASAVYGSDALSGVVNFIMRDHLDGVRIDAQAGIDQNVNDDSYLRGLVAQRGYLKAPSSNLDGAKESFNASAGKNFADGRGNITIYGGYQHSDPVLQSTRDVSACALNASGLNALTCGGSSNTTFGSFDLLTGPNAGASLTNSKDGTKTWVPYNSSYAYNYAPTNYFQREDQRYTTGTFAKYKFNDAAELYGNFMYMYDHTYSQAAPSALFLGAPFTINCDNPLMSASQASMLCGAAAGTSATEQSLIGYRLNGYPRRDNLRHSDYRFTAGLRGDLGHGFSYDVNVLQSHVQYDETYTNNVDPAKAQLALDAVNVNGTATCASGAAGCVPIDVFQANAITGAQAKYLFSPSNTHSRNNLTVFSGTLNGDLGTFGVKSPWAGDRGVSIALGAEHREETLNFTADAVAQAAGTTDSDGVIDTTEIYGEFEVPILRNQPFAHELTFDAGYRYSFYNNKQHSTGFSSSFDVPTYKAELDWAPTTDVRLRASYNRAIRAPNITELFASQGVGNVAADDPCAGPTPTGSLQACEKTGVTQAQYQAGSIFQCPADTCDQLYGGNKNLKPEKGDTYTIGVVLTPRAIRNFSLTVDYYHIKVNHYIGSIDPSLIISQCMSTSDPYYCGLFHRDPTSGAIFGSTIGGGYIVSTTLNTGYLETSGVDFTADYTRRIGAYGKLNFNLVGTLLAGQVSEPLPGLGTYDCKGMFGYTCGEPNPIWRHVARVTWTAPNDATLSLGWRYFDAVKLSSLSSNPFLAGTPSQINSRIPAYNYFDLAGTWKLTNAIELRAGVNNLFDKAPPAIAAGILSAFGNGNTYPGVYDPLGRNLFVGVTAAF